jgi:hypothetical protein
MRRDLGGGAGFSWGGQIGIIQESLQRTTRARIKRQLRYLLSATMAEIDYKEEEPYLPTYPVQKRSYQAAAAMARGRGEDNSFHGS